MEKIRKAEWAAAITLTAVVILLLIVRTLQAGTLWRDECAALQLARMPAWSEILKNFQFDSFPLLFPATIRAYTGVFGTSDGAMRGFGLLVGMLLIAVLWFNARLLYGRPPLVSLALVGLNGTFLIWGTSIRGYGLGSICILLAFGLMEKMRRTPTPGWMVAALGASLASAHYLFYNTALLFAIGCAVLAISFLRREGKPALAVAGIGLVCGLSMIPYIGFYSSVSGWNMLLKHDVDLGMLGSEFISALGSDSILFLGIWAALFLAIAVAGISTFRRRRADSPGVSRDGFYFGLLVMLASLLAYYAFLRNLSYIPRPWYFLALIAILAAAGEMMAENILQTAWYGWLRLGLVVAATLSLPFLVWPQITKRQTNLDLVAKALEPQLSPKDLIVVTPWYLGVTFHWYYAGTAPWITLPELADHRTHRYDLMKEKMMDSHPMDHVLELAGKTLRSGNRLWIVGGVNFLKSGESPLVLPPAPQSAYGWADPAYSETWSAQLGAYLQRHATRAELVRVPVDHPVDAAENVPLLVITGWRE